MGSTTSSSSSKALIDNLRSRLYDAGLVDDGLVHDMAQFLIEVCCSSDEKWNGKREYGGHVS